MYPLARNRLFRRLSLPPFTGALTPLRSFSVHSSNPHHAKPRAHSVRVHHTQVAIPANGDDIDGKDAMLKGHELEVDHLHKGPDHPVGREGGEVALLELLLGRTALEHGHAPEEHADEGRREQQLVAGHAGHDLGVLVPENDALREDLEPGCRGRAEDGWEKIRVSFYF